MITPEIIHTLFCNGIFYSMLHTKSDYRLLPGYNMYCKFITALFHYDANKYKRYSLFININTIELYFASPNDIPELAFCSADSICVIERGLYIEGDEFLEHKEHQESDIDKLLSKIFGDE